jgi:hypothetical protein
MSNNVDRRDFMKKSVIAGAAASLALNMTPPADAAQDKASQDSESAAKMPVGKIGKLNIGRLISGGNLISGWSHSRDLRYVSQLQRTYNTPEKVIETLALCEANGINAIISDPADKPMDIYKEHWRRGGKIQWIAEGHPDPDDLETNVKRSIDWGASAIYVQGVIGDRWYKTGHFDKLAKVLDIVRKNGLPAGIGAHMLEVIIASEAAGFKPDFYVKTLHHGNYWSARTRDQKLDVIDNPSDNYWSVTPVETIEFFKKVEVPWIAFKTLAAGAIHPSSGFDYAFKNGADFICVGMFDFQVAEDASIARDVVARYPARTRPWRA